MKTLRRHLAIMTLMFLLLNAATNSVRGEKVYHIANATELNRVLNYIYPPAPLPTPDSSGAPVSTSFPLPRPNSIKVEVGMKLVFRATPLRYKGTNTQTPGLMVYEWIAPERSFATGINRFTREDYFFLQYMLAAGIPVNCNSAETPSDLRNCNTIEQFEELKNAIQSGGPPESFWELLSQRVLVPSFDSLMLVAKRNSPFTAPNRSASELRQLFAEPSLQDFEVPEERTEYLRFNFPGRYKTLEIDVYNWSSAFFNDSVTEKQRVDESHAWYQRNPLPSGARGYIEVMVPVRISDKSDHYLALSDYFPVYFSIADLQQKLGITVRGLRRRQQFAGNFTLLKKQIDQQKLISPKDGYFTLWFDKSEKGYGAKAVLRAQEQWKKEILIAPGDIIMIDKKRLSPTDHPEVR